MERRVADVDSHEDMLAVGEAQLAEQMWEDKMGSSSQSRPPTMLHALHASAEVAKKESAIANLRQGYQRFEQSKKQHELIRLDEVPRQPGKRRMQGGSLHPSKRLKDRS